MTQTAPAPFTTPADVLPEGEFLLPLCVTRESVLKLLNAIKRDEILSRDRDFTAQFVVLEALAYIDNPQDAPCYPDCGEEDTLADDIANFLDGIIQNFQEGGIVKAIGYAIGELGRIVIETAVRVVSTTVIGLAVAGIVYIVIGGVTVGTVAVGANEIVDIVFDTGTGSSKIIEFIYEVAA